MSANFFIQAWKPLVEIVILWFLIYRILFFLIGTRAVKVLAGIAILIVAFFLAQKIGLQVIDWIFAKLIGISVIAVFIIFHPEIRQGLAQLGQRRLSLMSLKDEELDSIVGEISRAAESLAREKIGALIAIERNDPLNAYTESGEEIDAKISVDLLQAIFTPNNPLHDGAVIIRQGRIMAAACLFPLARNADLSRIFGTRHRAAIGLSEETDALVVVVSEERRDISLVFRGRLFKDVSREELSFKIKEIIKKKNA